MIRWKGKKTKDQLGPRGEFNFVRSGQFRTPAMFKTVLGTAIMSFRLSYDQNILGTYGIEIVWWPDCSLQRRSVGSPFVAFCPSPVFWPTLIDSPLAAAGANQSWKGERGTSILHKVLPGPCTLQNEIAPATNCKMRPRRQQIKSNIGRRGNFHWKQFVANQSWCSWKALTKRRKFKRCSNIYEF